MFEELTEELLDLSATVRGHGAAVYALDVAGRSVDVSVLSMGNPHAVQLVADIERAPVAAEGPLIERHRRFPQRVNAGYMQIVSRRRILLRVHERGAGETLACGSGACLCPRHPCPSATMRRVAARSSAR